MAKFSIITTCKGRLSHLKQTLPRFVGQRDTEVIVVDYSCPERTATWVRENYPEVIVVEVPDGPHFRVNHARNVGAASANGHHFVFLDADTLIADDFIDRVEPLLKARTFLRFRSQKGNDLNGACIIASAYFHALHGYDDVIVGYGGGEQDLYWRLRRTGIPAERCSIELLRAIAHDNATRMANYVENDLRKSFLQVRAYRLCKEAILGVVFSTELARSQREQLWQTVKDAIATGKDRINIVIPHPLIKSGFLNDWEFKRVVNVCLERKVGAKTDQ